MNENQYTQSKLDLLSRAHNCQRQQRRCQNGEFQCKMNIFPYVCQMVLAYCRLLLLSQCCSNGTCSVHCNRNAEWLPFRHFEMDRPPNLTDSCCSSIVHVHNLVRFHGNLQFCSDTVTNARTQIITSHMPL